jgi:phosphate transport system permease protein
MQNPDNPVVNPVVNPVYRRRLLAHRIGMCLSIAAMAIGLGFLAWILFTLLKEGLHGLSMTLFTMDTPAPGSPGGLRNALVGSLLLVGLSTAISTPIGILAGIYLAEYGQNNKFAAVTRFVTDVMLSAPSIVIGLFVYALYVAKAGHFSGYAGTIALSLISIPVVLRTTDNMLHLVPNALLEAAFALGAPRWKVALMVRLRAVKAGVMTGVLLAVARVAGETAPLLFTTLNNQFFSVDMNQPLANMPVVIYQFAMSSYEDWRNIAWGGALLVTCSVLFLNILSRTAFRQKNPQ